MLDAKMCVEIYGYCQKQYDKLAKIDGHYCPRHDKAVFSMAAKEFKISIPAVNKAFDIVAGSMPKRTNSKEIINIIRKKLITGYLM